MASKARKSATEQEGRPVKLSVSIDASTHAKLAALAALRRCSQSTIAAEAIRATVSSIVVFDRAAKSSASVDPTDEGIGGADAA